MSKLTAYLLGGQPLGQSVGSWVETDLNGNDPFKIEDVVSNNYQDISSIINWDSFGEIATSDCELIRNEIKSFYDSTTFSALSVDEKEIVARWFIANKSERDSVKSESEQEIDAKILSDCMAKKINDNIVQSIINTDGDNINSTYNENTNLVTSVNGMTGSVNIDFESTTINDSVTATSSVWSSDKIQTILNSSVNTEYGDFYDSVGGSNTTSNWLQIPLNSERKKDSPFSHNPSSDEITINTTDVYMVIGRVSTIVTSSSRTQAEARLELDNGSGFSEVEGTIGKMYLRQTNHGASCNFVTVLSLNSGDKIRMSFRRTNGSGTVQTVPNGSSLVILKIKGEKGEKGDPGSGNSIIVQKDDSTIGSSTEELNFEGNVTVSDNGSNKTTITVGGSVLGSEYYYTSSETESTTTSSTWSEKVRLSETLQGGTYRISWYAELTNSNTSSDTGLRLSLDDTNYFSITEFEPEDSNGFEPQSGFYVLTITSGFHNIYMDFNENGNGTGKIKNARLEIMRIS